MECFGATDIDNNSRLITLSAIIISGHHCSSISTDKTDTNIGSHCQCETPYLVTRTNEISSMKTQNNLKKSRKHDVL
jgi:hypothetical protein